MGVLNQIYLSLCAACLILQSFYTTPLLVLITYITSEKPLAETPSKKNFYPQLYRVHTFLLFCCLMTPGTLPLLYSCSIRKRLGTGSQCCKLGRPQYAFKSRRQNHNVRAGDAYLVRVGVASSNVELLWAPLTIWPWEGITRDNVTLVLLVLWLLEYGTDTG